MTLNGTHVLVTGGGTGVGAAIALRLAESGAQVTITGRRRQPLERTAGRHAGIFPQQADVTNTASMAEMVRAAVAERGAFTIAVANAGAADSAAFATLDDAAWSNCLAVNLTGVFNTYKACLPGMEAAGWGRLIAVASTAGLKGYSYVSAYCAAKHGVIGLTRSLAAELARSEITVNAICPGFTETPLLEKSITNIMTKTGMSHEKATAALTASNPQGRFVQPDEVAATVMWLIGPYSAAITGQAISVSGGEI